jgi:hypothetical protein
MLLGLRKQKMQMVENGNLRLLSANGNGKLPFGYFERKRQTSDCLLQTETGNECLFSLAGK